MKRETLSAWTSRLLLGFVLITIGFAAGRRTAPPPAPVAAGLSGGDTVRAKQVVVYAVHMTFRCSECTQIEWLARELIEKEFAGELADGRLVFSTVDYMRDMAFARRYDISSSTLVVSRMEQGEEKSFDRLDEVWAKVHNRDDFFAYVRAAIRKQLDGEDGV